MGLGYPSRSLIYKSNFLSSCGTLWHVLRVAIRISFVPWWRHQMEAFSALLAICAGNSPVSGEFPAQRPVTRGFDVFCDQRPNKWLSKQSWGWWFEMHSPPLWHHCNAKQMLHATATFNTLRPRYNGRHFADNMFKCIFLNENVWIPNKISLKFVSKGPINYIPALVQIMARRRAGAKPLSETMMVRLLTHICVTQPQWVKHTYLWCFETFIGLLKHLSDMVASKCLHLFSYH